MIERYPKLRHAIVPAAVLAGSLALAGCGSEKAGGAGESYPIATKAPQTQSPDASPSKLTPPAVPTPDRTGSRLKNEQINDGESALVCKALAAILNPDGTKRIIAQPIVWDKQKAPVEIMNLASGGVKVEERDKMPMEWYGFNGKQLDEKSVVCQETAVYTAYNKINNNQVVAITPEVGLDFKADFHAVHDGTLVQHDLGPYDSVEVDELLGQLKQLG